MAALDAGGSIALDGQFLNQAEPKILLNEKRPVQEQFLVGSDLERCHNIRLEVRHEGSKKHIIAAFTDDDPENPYNWSTPKKLWILFVTINTVLNSTLGSAMPSGDIDALNADFNVTLEERPLGTSIFLVGYVFGPLGWSPMSEYLGRRGVSILAFVGFTIFTLATSFSPSFPAFVVFRLLAGLFASSPISVTGGTIADIYADPISRGRAMASFMAFTTLGPSTAPLISGYLSSYGWRWPFWFSSIFAALSLIPLILTPETFAPKLLADRAKKIRKVHSGVLIYAPLELEDQSWRFLVKKVLARPLTMFFTEPIVLFTCLFLALVYALQFMFFESYPIIFGGTYGFSVGEQGLAFLPIGIGGGVAVMIYLIYEMIYQRALRHRAPWTLREETRRLPLACMGGPCLVASLFWIGWTARADIPWVVPVLGGLLYGVAQLLIFMSMLNYVVDAYEIFAASALASSSASRSLFGVLLPLSTVPLYDRLGVAWGCSLLGFLSILLSVVPFVFIRYGERIRARSSFCQELARAKAKIAHGRGVKSV